MASFALALVLTANILERCHRYLVTDGARRSSLHRSKLVGQEKPVMTTFYSILIAAAVLMTCGPSAMYFADRAGIPDYGCNPDQKAGWTILYILTIFPAALAFGWLALMTLIAVTVL
jgi:hypothetical protein